jgi:DNA invertase Pin-like site-specific DNA recombinase
MDELAQRGVHLRVLALPALDYNTPAGRYVAQTFAALAELFRSESRQRQRAGIEAAKRAGRHLGRAPILTGQQIAEARRMVDDGRPPAEVARLFSVHPKTLRRALAPQ